MEWRGWAVLLLVCLEYTDTEKVRRLVINCWSSEQASTHLVVMKYSLVGPGISPNVVMT